MAGVCAALAAARHGADTVLIQDRPVLGGNASSEFRMHICGADRHGSKPNQRETGILEELLLEVKKRNPNPNFWMLDTVLWEKCTYQDNLTLLLNTHVLEVSMDGSSIREIMARQMTTETAWHISASIFLDATGDGSIAAQAGADWIYGRESRDTYGEQLAPETAEAVVQGCSLLFTARDMGHPVPFEQPEWAYTYTEEDLKNRNHSDITSGYWWIELGGDKLHTIDDAEAIRDELMKALYGIWGHIKNGGDHHAENYALDWISPVCGKRESRRIYGDYVLREQDLVASRVFDDAVAYGGWTMDCHVPGGLHSSSEAPNQHLGDFDAYTIPYRCLYSRNIDNLLLAGRIISCSYMAFSSTRVMATCALTGQAAGTAAAIAVREGLSPREVGAKRLRELQLTLMRDDCWLPGFTTHDPLDCAKGAAVTASASVAGAPAENVVNGYPRNIGDRINCWICPAEGNPFLQLALEKPEHLEELTLRFDSNLSREIMPTINRGIRARQVEGPSPELIRDYDVELLLGSKIVRTLHVRGNCHRLNRHPLDGLECDGIIVRPLATHGDAYYRIFEINAYRQA